MTGTILILAGAILLLSGIVVYKLPSKTINSPENKAETNRLVELVSADGVFTKNEKDTLRKIAEENSLDYELICQLVEEKIKLKKNIEAAIIDQNKRNGDDFEKYVAQKFSTKYFKIKEWAGDKYIDGKFAETTQQPDLLIDFSLKGETQSFAVECKWRSMLYNHGVEFAYPEQLKRYQQYEAEKNIPVFIAIGLGGKGEQPRELFIVPLSKIDSTFLHLGFLRMYEKSTSQNFYYNPQNKHLN